jgi:hypothetical protein
MSVSQLIIFRTRQKSRNVQEASMQREAPSSPEIEYAGNYAKLIKPEIAEKPIEDASRVFYLAEMTNMSLLLHDYNDSASKVHYQLPSDWEKRALVPSKVDDIELDILRSRGALSLPLQELCDKLVNAFFNWVAPTGPLSISSLS